MGYNFYAFDSSDFEDLVQALFQEILGLSATVYGLGPDGGRELSYTGKAKFGSSLEVHDGLWVVQAKFKKRDSHDCNQFRWVKLQFISEMRKFESGRLKIPDQYIFVTNCVLTPASESGGRDRMDRIAKDYSDLIPRIYIIAYDELCKLILNNASVRLAYSHLMHPGDEFAQIKKLLDSHVNKPLIMADQEIRPRPYKQSNTVILPNRLILNIDFGTTYSLCSTFIDSENIELIPSVTGNPLLSSVVTFFDNGCYMVGDQNLKRAKIKELLSFVNIKRELGTGRKYNVFGKRYTAEEIASLIVKSLKISAEEYYGFEFEEVIVSKPANYNIRQTKALHDVFENANLKVSRMLDEGSSPSYLFPKLLDEYLPRRKAATFLIIDLGGGTFDISVQEYEHEVLETICVLGDNFLGGIDYDKAILDLAVEKIKKKYPLLKIDNSIDYLLEAERVKKQLTNSESSYFFIADYDIGDGNAIDASVEISKSDFRACTSSLNTKIMQYLNQVRQLAKGGPAYKRSSNIDAIMLTGQGTKIFTVKEIIDLLFPHIPIIDKYMENAVCLGNAYQAGVLNGTYNKTLMLNVHNTRLAIKSAEDAKKVTSNIVIPIKFDQALNTIFTDLVKANTTIPFKQNFVLELETKSKDKILVIPVYEFSNSSKDHEEVTKLMIPVTSGRNRIRLILDVAVNNKITFHIENEAANYSEYVKLI